MQLRSGPTAPRQRGALALLALSGLSLVLARSGASHADASRALSLEWLAPAGCPSREDVVLQVEQLLGRPESHAKLTARASVSNDGRVPLVWHVSIDASRESGTGRRELHARSCAELADATALILALMIDPEALAHQAGRGITSGLPGEAAPVGSSVSPSLAAPLRASSSATPSTSPSATAPPAAASAPPAPAAAPATKQEPAEKPQATAAPPDADQTRPQTPPLAASKHPGKITLRFGPAAALSAPTNDPRAVSYGIGGVAGLSIDPMLFELTILGWLGENHALAGFTDVGGDLTAVSFSLSACPFTGTDRWEVGACALGDLEYASARAFGPAPNLAAGTESGAWTSLGAGGYLAWKVAKWLTLPLRLEVIAPLTRPSFVIDGLTGVVYQPPALAARGILGAKVTLF